MAHTIGISPKVLYPVLAALGVVAQQWATTGRFDRTELVSLIMTVMYAAIGFVAPPGQVGGAGADGADMAFETTADDLTGLDVDDDLPGGLSADAEDDVPPDLPVDDAGTLTGAGEQR
jgi:hypothetical protein